MAKLQRCGSAWRRIWLAFVEIKDELVVYFGSIIVLIYLASVGIYYCEHDAQPEAFCSVFHAKWRSIRTLTTVGYGDVHPVTFAGRLLTFGRRAPRGRILLTASRGRISISGVASGRRSGTAALKTHL